MPKTSRQASQAVRFVEMGGMGLNLYPGANSPGRTAFSMILMEISSMGVMSHKGITSKNYEIERFA
jgi:hypothetical protein